MQPLELMLVVGGLLHFSILIASALVPDVLQWRSELQKLQPLCRQVVWTHGGFIVLVIVGFGAITLLNIQELASGSTLARSFAGMLAVFWGARLLLQFVYFDARDHLSTWWLKAGYHALTGVFLLLTAVYSAAAALPAHSAR